MYIETDKVKVLDSAIDTFGKVAQIDMCIEECAELIVALSNYKRGRCHNVEEEIADVFIMIIQMKSIFDPDLIQSQVNFKIDRLEGRVEKNRKQQ